MRRLRFLLVAGVATAVLVGGGVLVLGGDEERERATPAPKPFETTSLADYDAADAVVERAPFCEAVDGRQVEAVLGSEPDVAAWSNGDRLDVDGDGEGKPDVVHEFGCRYAVPDVGAAEAWVFAPPVDGARAARLVASAKKGPGCEVVTGPPFGSPTLALTCTTRSSTVRASYRGLFGDAWLVCEVELSSTSGVDAQDAAGRWCVGVLQAAGGGGA